MSWWWAYLHRYSGEIQLKTELATGSTLSDRDYAYQEMLDGNTNIEWISKNFEALGRRAAEDAAVRLIENDGYSYVPDKGWLKLEKEPTRILVPDPPEATNKRFKNLFKKIESM